MSISFEEGLKAYRDRDLESLLERKKLHLVLDLDHTLIHSREKTKLTLADKQLILNRNLTLPEILNSTYVVKLRPGVDVFLREVSTMFDLSICTMAIENYAKQVKNLLEDFDNGVQFREVLSREDCHHVMNKKSLDRFLSHERVVVIIDDTDHVWMNWSHNEANLVKIDRYKFFRTHCVPNPRPRSKLEGVEGKEESMDKELARVLAILRSVHDGFFGGSRDCVDRDVREVLKLVLECEEHKRRAREESKVVNAVKGKREHEAAASFDQPSDSCEPAAAKRYSLRLGTSGGAIQGASLTAFKGLMSQLRPSRQQCTPTSNMAKYHMCTSYDYMRGMTEKESNNLDLLQWWRTPVTSAIARDFLSIQVSSDASESCFSGANRVLDEIRTRLRPDTLKMLVCYKDWMDAKNRQQDKVDHENENDSDETSTSLDP